MNRARLLGFAALLATLILGLLPAKSSAAPLTFRDPPGDANQIGGQLATGPHPSDPELDVLTVGFATPSDSLVLTMQVQKFGVPLGAAEASFTWFFTYNDLDYGVAVALSPIGPLQSAAPVFWRRPDGKLLGCPGCSVAHDAAARTIRAILPLKSMSAAMRGANPSQPELGRGSRLKHLFVLTDRMEVATAVGDYADGGSRVFRI